MDVYIGYRNLPEYFTQQNQCGGTPVNTDHRLTTAKSGVYILTFGGLNYAGSRSADCSACSPFRKQRRKVLILRCTA